MKLKENLVDLYIFTPTYNRNNNLHKLYYSLENQTFKNFIWLVVDDGSNDGTDEFINDKILEGKINIKYIKKENGGKHTAYNTALDNMNLSSYHVCVDSDDYLSPDAVYNFHRDILSIENSNNIVGLLYPKIEKYSNYLNWLDDKIKKLNIPDLQYKYNLNIETCILINNKYLSDFRFKVFSGEKFLSEGEMYIYISKFGYFIPIKRKVYYYEYLENGLTRNLFNIWIKNINGTIYTLDLSYVYIIENLKGLERIKGIIRTNMNKQALLLTRFSIKNIIFNKEIKYKMLLPFSIIWKYIRFKE